jgi:hypothetical protein
MAETHGTEQQTDNYLATPRRFRHTDRMPLLPRSRCGTGLLAGAVSI